MSGVDKAVAFFATKPASIKAFEDLSSYISTLCPDAMIAVQGSLLVFKTSAGFAYVSLPSEGERDALFNLALRSRRKPEGPRIDKVVQAVPGTGSYVYHVTIRSEGDIDGELKLWIKQSYEYSKLVKYA